MLLDVTRVLEAVKTYKSKSQLFRKFAHVLDLIFLFHYLVLFGFSIE